MSDRRVCGDPAREPNLASIEKSQCGGFGVGGCGGVHAWRPSQKSRRPARLFENPRTSDVSTTIATRFLPVARVCAVSGRNVTDPSSPAPKSGDFRGSGFPLLTRSPHPHTYSTARGAQGCLRGSMRPRAHQETDVVGSRALARRFAASDLTFGGGFASITGSGSAPAGLSLFDNVVYEERETQTAGSWRFASREADRRDSDDPVFLTTSKCARAARRGHYVCWDSSRTQITRGLRPSNIRIKTLNLRV